MNISVIRKNMKLRLRLALIVFLLLVSNLHVHASGIAEEIVSNDTPQRIPAQVVQGARHGTAYSRGDGYFFRIQRIVGGRTYLQCINRGQSPPCQARARMNADNTNLEHLVAEHNHDPDPLFAREMELRRAILESAGTNFGSRLDTVYHRECSRFEQQVSSRVTLTSMRTAMYRVQNERRPQIPHSFDEMHNIIQGDFRVLGDTHDGTERFYAGLAGREVGSRSLVFASQRMLQHLASANTIFVDGTFFTRPTEPKSSQLLAIVTVRDHHVVPVLHALMESRTYVTYMELFGFIRNLVPNLDCSYIMSDFEYALQSALRVSFPRASVHGCYFHYTNALCRNARRLGLTRLLVEDEQAKSILMLCMALPLCPAQRMQEAMEVIEEISQRSNFLDTLHEFFHYLRNTWLLGVGTAVLSVFGLQHRTNNCVESHNRNLNAKVGVRRPNVWRFLDVIRDVEETAWRDVGRLEMGNAPSRGRRTLTLLEDETSITIPPS